MSLKSLENMSSVSRERLMDPNADLTDSEIRLGKGEQIKVRRLNHSSITYSLKVAHKIHKLLHNLMH